MNSMQIQRHVRKVLSIQSVPALDPSRYRPPDTVKGVISGVTPEGLYLVAGVFVDMVRAEPQLSVSSSRVAVEELGGVVELRCL